MVRKLLKGLLYFLGFLLLLSICLIVPLDRSPKEEFVFYEQMTLRLDSLEKNYVNNPVGESLKVGFGKVSITPSEPVPLAGYGARKPKEFDQVLDSVFVRAIVFDNNIKRTAVLSADLLIIHPEVTAAFYDDIKKMGWERGDVFLGATHSHSSIGGWAPGLAGKMFSGKFDEEVQGYVVSKMVEAVEQASNDLDSASISFVRNEMGVHVKNRLIKGGDEDAWMRNLLIRNPEGVASISAFAAHATCFSMRSRALTGDFPSYFHSALEEDSLINYSMFMAGAVGSMGPEASGLRENDKAEKIGQSLAEQISLLSRLGVIDERAIDISAFRLKVPLRPAQAKISRNLALRPWLFRAAFGDYESEVSVLKLGSTVLIGMPCDFSGELAIPLYEYAYDHGINLIITSFNGGYIGYVTKDEWYDLEKYETRSMNWHGPDSGAYFSEIVKRIIDSVK